MSFTKHYFEVDDDMVTYCLFTPFIDKKGIEIYIGDRIWYKVKGKMKSLIVSGMIAKAVRKIDYDPYSGSRHPYTFVSKYIVGTRDDDAVVSLWNFDQAEVSLSHRGVII